MLCGASQERQHEHDVHRPPQQHLPERRVRVRGVKAGRDHPEQRRRPQEVRRAAHAASGLGAHLSPLETAPITHPADSAPLSAALLSTSDFLGLSNGAPLTFDGVGVKNVRGILCERWSHNFTLSLGPRLTFQGIASYYFPITTWKNRGERYHRLLKRIEVNGSAVGNSSMTYFNSYEFVDMVS